MCTKNQKLQNRSFVKSDKKSGGGLITLCILTRDFECVKMDIPSRKNNPLFASVKSPQVWKYKEIKIEKG